MKFLSIFFVVGIVVVASFFLFKGDTPKEGSNILEDKQEEKIDESMDKDIIKATARAEQLDRK